MASKCDTRRRVPRSGMRETATRVAWDDEKPRSTRGCQTNGLHDTGVRRCPACSASGVRLPGDPPTPSKLNPAERSVEAREVARSNRAEGTMSIDAWTVGAAGSSPDSRSGGRGFEPRTVCKVVVVQRKDVASPWRRSGFDSPLPHFGLSAGAQRCLASYACPVRLRVGPRCSMMLWSPSGKGPRLSSE